MPHMSAQPRARASRLGVLLTLCALAAAAGCASTTPSTATSAAAGNSASAQPTATASPTASSYAAQLTFADSGKTITLHVGGTVHVALDSTYWTFQPAAAPQMLKLDHTALVPPAPGTCAHPVPGSGCGSETADFTALATGQTSVMATRVNCGEAMRCTGANGHFEVQIVIVN